MAKASRRTSSNTSAAPVRQQPPRYRATEPYPSTAAGPSSRGQRPVAPAPPISRSPSSGSNLSDAQLEAIKLEYITNRERINILRRQNSMLSLQMVGVDTSDLRVVPPEEMDNDDAVNDGEGDEDEDSDGDDDDHVKFEYRN